MNNGKVFYAFIGGAIVGGILGVLLAPKSGEMTRAQLRKFFEDEKDKINDALDEVRGEYEEIKEEAASRKRAKK